MDQELEDLRRDIEAQPDDLENYIDATSYNVQQVNVSEKFASGTIKITPELMKQAKLAIEERISGTKEYTKARTERIKP